MVNTEANLIWIRGADEIRLMFCFFPHKCSQSGDWIWFKTAYRISQRLTYNELGTTYRIDRWYTIQDYHLLLVAR